MKIAEFLREDLTLPQLAASEKAGALAELCGALARAYPRVKSAQLAKLRKLRPDAVVGAWERLAEAVGSVDARGRPLAAKLEWATRISPHLNLHTPASPSLQKFMQGVARELSVKGAT